MSSEIFTVAPYSFKYGPQGQHTATYYRVLKKGRFFVKYNGPQVHGYRDQRTADQVAAALNRLEVLRAVPY